ncbi:hypothetical protein ACQKGP_19525 [Lysinibacillus fusiformis]|uniref:hypothetical protein n=1 Tax=Lysinibacillus fusiformis TaxID=28031 RepID=UPI003CFC4EBE
MFVQRITVQIASIQYGTDTIEYDIDENGQTTKLTLNGQPAANFTWNKNSY